MLSRFFSRPNHITVKVEQQRQTRNALFARLNREAEGEKRADDVELAVNLMLFSTDDLLSLAHAGELIACRSRT